MNDCLPSNSCLKICMYEGMNILWKLYQCYSLMVADCSHCGRLRRNSNINIHRYTFRCMHTYTCPFLYVTPHMIIPKNCCKITVSWFYKQGLDKAEWTIFQEYMCDLVILKHNALKRLSNGTKTHKIITFNHI